MKWYPWLRPYFEKWMTMYALKRLHYALLIESIPGMGEELLIYAISCFLMCKKPKKNQNCRECYHCNLMKKEKHPDFYVIELERNTSIDDYLSVTIEKLYRYSLLGSKKIVWIRSITGFKEELIFKITKILENPPKNTWFFLSYYEFQKPIIQLRSYCYFFYLNTPKESWSLMWLRKEINVSEEKALSILRTCNGSPGSALTFIKTSACSQREIFFNLLENALKKEEWLSLLSFFNQDDDLDRLYWLILLLLDALKIKQEIQIIVNVDHYILIRDVANSFSVTHLLSLLREICVCRKRMFTISGINRELLLMNQLVNIEHYFQIN